MRRTSVRGLISEACVVALVMFVVAALAVQTQRKAITISQKQGEDSSGVSCTYYVSPSGSDENPGTLDEPLKTVQKAFDTVTAGETVCFRAGTYPETVLPNPATKAATQLEKQSGTPGNPIVFTNYPGEVAIIQGETKIYGSYIILRGTAQSAASCSATNRCGLVFERTDNVLYAGDIDILNSSGPGFVIIDHVEIRNAPYHAGIYQEGCNNAIIGSYIHDNGTLNRSEDNGIYWSRTPADCKNGGLIAGNLVEHNYSKGIQLYAGGSATTPAYVTVCGNISVNNGSLGAVVWGDHNVFSNNIFYNNNEIVTASAGAQAGLYSGAANVVDHNLTWSSSDRGGKRSSWYVKKGCCLKDNLIADPSFLDPQRHNWNLKPSSPAGKWATRNCSGSK